LSPESGGGSDAGNGGNGFGMDVAGGAVKQGDDTAGSSNAAMCDAGFSFDVSGIGGGDNGGGSGGGSAGSSVEAGALSICVHAASLVLGVVAVPPLLLLLAAV
jgi:hypothetical protein